MKGRAKPLYEQIKDAIRAQILSGKLKAEELAPSEADIINEYGVSSITARRCLNDLENEGYVQRIKGRGTYVRTLDALELRRHVGLFYHELISLSGSFISSAFSGVLAELRHTKLEPDLLSWAPVRRSSAPAEALVDLAQLRQVDASLLLSPAPAAWLQDLIQNKQPVVSLGFSYDDPEIYSVLVDYSLMAEERDKRLHGLGHKRVAIVHEHFDEPAEGVVFQVPRWNTDLFEVNRIEIPYMQYDKLRHAIRALVEAKNGPTLYYVYGYELALYVRQFLNDCGLEIPQEVSLIVAGNSPGPTRFELEEMPTSEMGRAAVGLLLKALKGGSPVNRTIKFPLTRRAGMTLGPAFEGAAAGGKKSRKKKAG